MFSKSQLALVISAVLSTPFAYAETDASTTDEHMVVTGRDYGYKADTNSSSMRMEATQLETPGQVSVIDEQLIDEQRASTLGEVLKNDASIGVGATTRNREQFTLRGFELSSSSGFLRDGKQHWSHYRQPIELLERVEILKGPSGLLYGQSAPGGLVNMVAKKPTYETQISVSQDLGSNNDSRTTADVSGALNDDQTLRGRAIVSKQTYNSWRQYSDGTVPSTERFVGGLFLDYDINDDITVSFHYDRTIDEGSVDSGAYIKDGKTVVNDKYIWDAQWSKIENDVENIGVDVTANLTDVWRVNASFNHQDFNRHDVESFPKEETYDPSNGTYDQGGSDRKDNWVFKTASIDLIGEFDALGVSHQMLFGSNWLGYRYDRLEYSFNSSVGQVGEPAPAPERNPNKDPRDTTSKYDTWGFYAQDMITFNEQWQALVGVRLDRQVEEGLAEEAVSPKFAVIYHPMDIGSIYATYSESFEMQGEVSGSEYVNDGQKLDPLRGKLYELGTKWELMDNQLFVSGAVFDITQENSTIDVDLGGGKKEKTQSGERVHRGVELAMQGFITEQLSMSGSATYLDAEYAKDEKYEGNRPADVPEYTASVWTRYAFTNSTDANLGAIYVGERYGDAANTFKKDGYARFDLGLSHTIKYDQDLTFVARFNVENLFDTDYLAGGGSTGKNGYATDGASNVVIGEGRNYMATLQVKY
ncbi:TonB-dependent siderophore receptor [Aliivibrio fischeri]|uniref:TonB-dependent siderophore receptor n=1 Tax=Aliivibrio fischeri TaxID=668 RepID=UPI0007C4E19D|nr:TonB-dependent siderophore receptor [Aliivibrio fischeri]MBP3139449.1 TonB-dependent siderophore receptor [Aliivibrio fischeri]MBP3155039.1 TonB-dependent siderophore receptor [Aliivibrio fischeri]MCE7573211.1 TonB-dependent siderophore receptor [Aliivibrio fischeri]